MSEWFTPPQIARSRQIRVGKVLTWIRSGELAAVNCAEKPRERPRWRVSAAALEAFDRGRSNRRDQVAAPRARRGRGQQDVIEFF